MIATECGTCDACAEGGKRLVCVDAGDMDAAWICEDCIAFHEAAVDAAFATMNPNNFTLGEWVNPEFFRARLATAIKAYCEFNGDAMGVAS